MRDHEVVAGARFVGDALDVVVRTVRDVHRAVANRVFRGISRGVGSAGTPPQVVHDTVADAAYTAVGASLSTAVDMGGRLMGITRPADAPAVADSRRGAAVVAAINGLWGDHLADQASALDLGMALRADGASIPTTSSGLATAHPAAGSRLAVFVHGLCENEAYWWSDADAWAPDDPPTHGHRLQRDLGFTPVFVRYNTGRRVSVSGGDLDDLLTAVHDHWPVPVDEIALVGHSMGGLVARSAVHRASTRDAAWAGRVRDVVCLGTPHHGAPLEKAVNAGAWALGWAGESRPFAAILNRRSLGVKDLRYGNVRDQDWRDHDPDALLTDTRTTHGIVPGVGYHVFGASVTRGPVGRVLGDGFVRTGSATGRHRRRSIAFNTTISLDQPMHHFSLLNHPAAYDAIRDALATAPDPPRHPEIG